MGITKQSAIPLYRQIAATLKKEIANGTFPEGSVLPSETDLAERFHASRVTIRASMKLLADEGLIVRKQGKGTFVARGRQTIPMDSLRGFYSALVRSGGNIQTRLLFCRALQPPDDIVQVLEAKHTAIVRQIQRLYLKNKEPLAVIHTYFSQDFPLTFSEASQLTVYGILVKKLGAEPKRALYKVTAIMASGKLCEQLGVPPRAPILKLTRISYDSNDRPLELTQHFIEPGKSSLEFRLEQGHPLEDLVIVPNNTTATYSGD